MHDVPILTGLDAMLRHILNEWDPIGVMPWGAPANEYDCMIPRLRSLVEQRADGVRFIEYLEHELAAHFGLGPNRDIPDVARRCALLGADSARAASDRPTGPPDAARSCG